MGRPSSGVWVFRNRRCCCAAIDSQTSSIGRCSMSIHGDIESNGAGNSGPSKTNNAHSICIHVVPLFGGVLITTSPARNTSPSHRALSETADRYRISTVSHTFGEPAAEQSTIWDVSNAPRVCTTALFAA